MHAHDPALPPQRRTQRRPRHRSRRPLAPRRLFPVLASGLALLWLLLVGTAAAHGTLVMGSVTASPDPPQPGKPLVVTVDLQNTNRSPVEGAKLAGVLVPAGQPGATPIPLAFREFKEPYGTYRAQLDAPPAGSYTLTIHDHTYPKENVAASVTLRVGGQAPGGSLDFTFPATRGPQRSLLSWLAWLVGLPLLTAIVVTVLVLRSKRSGEGKAGGGPPA